ncbi:MAG: DUF3298 domain-containing protein [bacterium]|nr:MAG: DUF3298 domain-containing protein [bacterium]
MFIWSKLTGSHKTIWIRTGSLITVLVFLCLPQIAAGGSLVWEMVDLTRGFEGCDPQGQADSCTYITYRFPAIMEGPNNMIVEALRSDVRRFLYDQGNYTDKDFYGIRDRLFRDFELFRNEFPDSALAWFIEKEVGVIHLTDRVVTLAKRSDTYFGGAHPVELRYFTSFDLGTGEPIRIQDLLLQGAIPRVITHAEEKFRKMKGLEPGAPYGESFFFPDGRFRLSDNMALTPNGLLFYYNVYQIEPYAMGPTELFIPYSELRGMTVSTGPLGYLSD